MNELNATHDPSRRCIVESANAPDTDFPIQNLPFGCFSRSQQTSPTPGVAIGDHVLDLAAVLERGALSGAAEDAARAAVEGPGLNRLMALGNGPASALRARLSNLLDAAGPSDVDLTPALVPISSVEMHLPTDIRNFTDFLTSGPHSQRLGRSGKLEPNFMSLPLAYHSRASSVRVGGDVIRPHVQSFDGERVRFGPSREIDFELEVGAFVARGNDLGDPIRIGDAASHLFGFCLVNDWSVRDLQRWESVPLGPFLAKSVSTTISPWVVTEEALRPYRAPAYKRGPGEWPPLPHLVDGKDQDHGALDLDLEALLSTARMREAGEAPVPITDTNARHLYWTFAQMLAHHTSNGCNMVAGDLFASGTASGPAAQNRACLAEITEKGNTPFTLRNGETRTWLEDGDEVILRARARREGFASLGFGASIGRLAPAIRY